MDITHYWNLTVKLMWHRNFGGYETLAVIAILIWCTFWVGAVIFFWWKMPPPAPPIPGQARLLVHIWRNLLRAIDRKLLTLKKRLVRRLSKPQPDWDQNMHKWQNYKRASEVRFSHKE